MELNTIFLMAFIAIVVVGAFLIAYCDGVDRKELNDQTDRA